MHPITRPDWLPERGMCRFDEIDPGRTALLVIDMQVVFVEDGQPATGEHSSAIVPNINRLSTALRDAGGVVAFTRHTITDEGPSAIAGWQRAIPRLAELEPLFRPGRREHGVDPSMDCQPGDIVLDKFRYSAFAANSSTLHDALQARGIDTVIVTGVVTNCCCETTARDAHMLGYKTFFVEDGTAAMSDEEHSAALVSLGSIFADVRTTDDILALIHGQKAKAA